ncbi:MAG TPA: LacI family DNA-binding transcriptional regulator [Actinoplanes sp.]|nr:LacI family DNA-binding transcriptional regulator [Actinoplanes sp.]
MGSSLRDVARLAGVSVKTVSNVVNDYVHVTEGTRERVRRAIAELNYRPNPAARSLRKRRSGLIGLAVPELGIPYFSELASLIIDAAAEQSWTVLVDQTNGLVERELLVSEGIRSHLLDGLIFSPLAMDAEQLARRQDDTPLVLLGERVFDGPADHVAIDNVAAARDATAHLVSLGRRRIAAIGDQRHVPTGRTAHLRLAGYRQALTEAGLPYDEDLVLPADDYHRADGAASMARLLELPAPPDAVLCFADLLALGALRTLLAAGRRVPEDVAVAGFDDIEDGRFSTPTLTTIRPDKEQIARLAVSFLLSRSQDGLATPPREVQARYDLVVRESTAGRPADRPARRSATRART